jgi:sterol desaturase/sphingolipid hydroxylase (fatty acid hydroxylase superfamily)
MEWITAIQLFWASTLNSWQITLIEVGVMGVVFAVLGALMPCNPGMFWWRNPRAAVTDFIYWFIVPVFGGLARVWFIILGVVLLYGARDPDLLPVRSWPLWLQCIAVLLIQDVVLYWMHRLFHSRLGWKFHAVHHAPKIVDWMTEVRFHPVNHLLAFGLADLAIVLLGFSPETLKQMVIFNAAYSAMVHANLNWTFGPLKYVFASPVFHRWHHTTETEALDKNFASTFPFLDLMFGTFHMPPGQLPQRFGTTDSAVPEGFWGQFLFPFRSGEETEGSGERRIGVCTAVAVAVVLLLVASAGLTAFWIEGREERAREQRLAECAHLQSLAKHQANQLALARQAWAENDLVRATFLLDETAAECEETNDQQHMRELCREKCRALTGHVGPVLGVAVSSDGRRIVSAGEDGTIKLWDTATAEILLTLRGHTGPVRCVAISSDGQRIVSGGKDRCIKVWDVATEREVRSITGHESTVLSVALSADGRRALSGSADQTMRAWDTESGSQELSQRDDEAAVPSVALSADGELAVSAVRETARLWETTSGQVLQAMVGHKDLIYCVAVSPDGAQAVSGSFDCQVKLWDTQTGQQKLTLSGHTGAIYSVAISADGHTIASGGEDQTVKVWDVPTGRELLTLHGHTDAVTGVAVSADGSHVVSASRDGTVKVWDVEKCKQEVRSEK